MGFKDRNIEGQKREDFFAYWIQEKLNLDCVRKGYESRSRSKEFDKNITALNDNDLLKIRYEPDFFIFSKDLTLKFRFEVKKRFRVEREAWKFYLEYNKDGPTVCICFVTSTGIWYQEVEKIIFKTPTLDNIITQEIIENKVWVCPRKLPQQQFYEFMKKRNCSGRDYTEISRVQSQCKNLIKDSLLETYQKEYNKIFKQG